MVVIILPHWTIELEEKLDKVIKDLAAKYHIDILAIEDSRAIERGKNAISHSLVDLYWNYKVEDRKRFEEFDEDRKNFEKSIKKKKKKIGKMKIRFDTKKKKRGRPKKKW